MLRTVYTTLSLAPSPLFFLGFLWSVFNTPAICGAWPYEMALMWLVMSLAHLSPWLLRWQQRDLTR